MVTTIIYIFGCTQYTYLHVLKKYTSYKLNDIVHCTILYSVSMFSTISETSPIRLVLADLRYLNTSISPSVLSLSNWEWIHRNAPDRPTPSLTKKTCNYYEEVLINNFNNIYMYISTMHSMNWPMKLRYTRLIVLLIIPAGQQIISYKKHGRRIRNVFLTGVVKINLYRWSFTVAMLSWATNLYTATFYV